jgi:hypothetical protein
LATHQTFRAFCACGRIRASEDQEKRDSGCDQSADSYYDPTLVSRIRCDLIWALQVRNQRVEVMDCLRDQSVLNSPGVLV